MVFNPIECGFYESRVYKSRLIRPWTFGKTLFQQRGGVNSTSNMWFRREDVQEPQKLRRNGRPERHPMKSKIR